MFNKLLNWKKTTLGVEITVDDCNCNLYEYVKNEQEDEKTYNEKTIAIFEPGDSFDNKRYCFISKIGYGGSSLVWLVVDSESNDFKAVKVFKYGHFLTEREGLFHDKTQNHPNIVRYFDCIDLNPSCNLALYEPLGKTLWHIKNETEKNGGLSNGVIKTIAKNILNALKVLHDECKVIHSDIKPANIAACASQKGFYDQIQLILNSSDNNKSLKPFRMRCVKDTGFDEVQRRKAMKEYMDALQISQKEEKLTFKLIDYGNIVENQADFQTTAGTYGYKPPENLLGADITYSRDIWSFGVTLLELFSTKFISYKKAGPEGEMDGIRKNFGNGMCRKFPLEWFSNFKDPYKLLPKCSKANMSIPNVENRIKNVIKKWIQSRKMSNKESNDLVEFLYNMLHLNPLQRKTAAELLKHPWLNITY